MVERFPPEIGDDITMTTKSALQRRVLKDEETGLPRISSVQIPMEFGRFALHQYGMTDLKKHFGPARVFERPDFNENAQRQFTAPVHNQSSRAVYPAKLEVD